MILRSRGDTNEVTQSSTRTRADSVELECLGDFDQPTAHSADALLRRDPPQLTRLTSSDREDDLEFDGTAADHDDDDDDEEHPPGHTGSVSRIVVGVSHRVF